MIVSLFAASGSCPVAEAWCLGVGGYESIAMCRGLVRVWQLIAGSLWLMDVGWCIAGWCVVLGGLWIVACGRGYGGWCIVVGCWLRWVWGSERLCCGACAAWWAWWLWPACGYWLVILHSERSNSSWASGLASCVCVCDSTWFVVIASNLCCIVAAL